MQQHEGARAFKYAMLLPAVLWVIAFTFFPLFSVIRYGFANYVLGRGITSYVGLHNFWTILNSGQFWHSVFITAVYVAVAVPIEVVGGFLLAWLVSLQAPGSKAFRGLIAAPLFTMGVAIGYLGVTLFTSEGGLIPFVLHFFHISVPWLSSTVGGLAAAVILDVWRWTPFVFLMALAALGAIPTELYEAAALDSSSHWEVMRKVAVPLAWPVMTVAILLRVIEGLKTFGLPYALTSGGPGSSTQLFSINDYLTTIQFFDFGHGSAMGILFLILVSVIIAVFFHQMRRRIG